LKPSETESGVGRQTEIHGHHRRLIASYQHQRALTIVGGQGLVLVESPANLFLQRSIVLDDQQVRQLLGTHSDSFGKSADASWCVRYRTMATTTSTCVPTSTALSTDSLPPSS
jgi:hypothetical protein